MKIRICLFIIIILNSIKTNAGVFLWTGHTNSNYATASNWSGGSGVPGSNDTILIMSAFYQPVLSQNQDVYFIKLFASTQFDLNGYVFTTQNRAEMIGGTMSNGTFVIRGAYALFSGTVFYTTIDAVAGVMELSGSVFHEPCYFEWNGSTISLGSGGCIFNDDVVLVQDASRTELHLANSIGDVFNGNLKVYLTNDSPVYLSDNDTTWFNGNVYVNNVGGSAILFGDQSGVSMLASGNVFAVGDSGYAVNDLYITKLLQIGNTTQNLTLTGGANLFLKGCSFDASVTLSAPGVLCAQSAFQDSVTITKTGTNANYWYGNNDFYGPATIANSGATDGSDELRLSGNYGNRFYGNATFESSEKTLNVDFKDNTEFYGNVTINNNAIIFEKSITFKGDVDQTLFGTTGYSFNDVTLGKISGTVTADTSMQVSGVFTFNSGYLLTDSLHLLTMTASSLSSGASDASFVSGPVKKVGDTSFIFPVGKNGNLRPIEISAPLITTDNYVAEFFDNGQSLGLMMDSTLGTINPCDFWTLIKDTSSSKVKVVTLTWNANSCNIGFPINSRVANWDGSVWKNIGNDYYEGNLFSGKVKSIDSTIVFGYFALANIGNAYTGAPDLGSACDFAILANGNINSTNTSLGIGKVGSAFDVTNVIATDSILEMNAGSVGTALQSISNSILYLNGLVGNTISNNLNGIAFNSGIYNVNGNVMISDTLELNGDSASVFIFNINGTLSLDSGVKASLGEVKPYNVFWNVNDEFVSEEFIDFPGIILCKKSISSYRYHNPYQAIYSLDSIVLYADELDHGNNIYFSPCKIQDELNYQGDPCVFPPSCNEIRNSTFDIFSAIPSGYSFIQYACPWGRALNGWGTTDYYHSSSSSALVDVPISTEGCQNDYGPSGIGYAGLFARNLGGNGLYREYLQQQLANTLNANTLYYSEMFVSLQDIDANSCNSIGMLYSLNAVTQFQGTPIPATPQIQSDLGVQLNDYIQWTRISGCFEADGTEGFVTIGNFNDNTTTVTATTPQVTNPLCTPTPPPNPIYIYYYIDNPAIIPFAVDAGPDQTINCGSGSVSLGLPTCINSLNTGQFTYLWSLISGTLPTGLSSNSIFDPVVTLNNTTSNVITQVYQVTVTSPNGCTDTDEVSVIVNPTVTVSLIATSSCTGFGGTITSTVTGGTSPYTYQWNNGSPAPNLNNLPNGTYTLTVTDAIGCTDVAMVTLTNTPYIFQLTGDYNNCQYSDNLNFVITPYISSQWQNYQWSVGAVPGPAPTLTVNTVNGTAFADFAPNVSGTITVTYMNTATNCTTSATLPIVICCEASAIWEERDDVLSSDYNSLSTPPPGITQGTTVTLNTNNNGWIIQRSITLNTNFVITNSDVIFGAGAHIIVQNGNTLSIDNSTLRGCDYLWKGIIVRPGGTIRILGDVIIRDAQYGLDIQNGGNYEIRGCDFIDNYVGIRVGGPTFSQRDLIDASFNGTGPLLPNYPNQNPVACSVGYAGMRVNNVTSVLNIGTLATSINFSNLVYGIFSNSSNTIVRNCEFTGIQTDQNINSCYGNGTNANGSGIYAYNIGQGPRTLNQRGFGMSNAVSFDDCFYGIYSREMVNDLQENNMSDVTYGVRMFRNSFATPSLIERNHIIAHEDGIDVFDPKMNSFTNVFYNEIEFTGNGSYSRGINITNTISTNGSTEVIENVIDLGFNNSRAGIYNSNTNLNRNGIIQNHINLNISSQSHRGIEILNSRFIEVKCNNVNGNSSTVGRGIYSSMSPSASVECNIADNTKFGIQFANNNDPVDFRTNTMSNNYLGFTLENACVIGDQFDMGNLWPSSSYGSFGAFATGGSLPNASRFFVDNPGAPPRWTTISSNPVFQVRFLPGCNTSNCWTACTTSTDCSVIPLANEDYNLTRLDSLIAQDSLLFELYNSQTIWNMRQNLVLKLLRLNELLESNELMTEFINNGSGTSYSISAGLQENIMNLYISNLPLSNYYIQYWNEIDSLIDLVILNDSIIQNPPSSQDSLDLIDENIQYRFYLDSLVLMTDSFGINMDSVLDAEFYDLISINSGVTAQESHEQLNQATVNIQLRRLIDNEFDNELSDSELEWLTEVAYLCPFEYGSSVYLARDLLFILTNNTTSFEDDSLCNSSEQRFATPVREIEPKKDYSELIIYPNPFSDHISIEIDDRPENFAKYELYNSMGDLVKQGTTLRFINNLTSLPPGLYVIRIKTFSMEKVKKIVKL